MNCQLSLIRVAEGAKNIILNKRQTWISCGEYQVDLCTMSLYKETSSLTAAAAAAAATAAASTTRR